ncbi:MAG TPA: hypothetical protein VE173_12525, partial [Longimicrobiales bacterium]|nr:hypothetical protein [Longimicrobiales bacterium]
MVGLTFRGVHQADATTLESTLATRAVHCRSWLYLPLCWTLDSPLFEEKPDLDPEELARDELRIRVFYFRRGWRDARASSRVEPAGNGVRVT